MSAPFTPAPPAAITRVLTRFDRDQLAGFVAVAIDLLDLAESDLELEEDDPPEDDDPAEEHDSQADAAWREVVDQTRPQFRHRDGNPDESTATGTPEDAEDDDPAEDADSDRCAAGDDHMIAGPVSMSEICRPRPEYACMEIGDDADAEDARQPVSLNREPPVAANAP